MRTTLDLDEDILKAARSLALERKQGIGKIVSDLAREALQRTPARLKSRKGFPVLPKQKDRVTTNALINRLREEEGI